MGATDDQLRALGRLTTEFSFLELTVSLVIWGLLNEAERSSGMILTSQLSFARLCKSAAALAQEKMKDVPGGVDQLRDVLKRVSRLEGDRNRLIHSLWLSLPTDPGGLLSRIKITAGRGLEIQFEPQVSPDDLNHIADDMSAAALDLLKFLKQHNRYPSTP